MFCGIPLCPESEEMELVKVIVNGFPAGTATQVGVNSILCGRVPIFRSVVVPLQVGRRPVASTSLTWSPTRTVAPEGGDWESTVPRGLSLSA